MYSSDACWKNDPKVVTSELGKLNSELAKYHSNKENIMIQVKGFGWNWCKHRWSKDGHKYSVFELVQHLRYIIREEKSMDIPSEPPFYVPQRQELGVLGTQTSIVAELDKKFAAKKVSTRVMPRRPGQYGSQEVKVTCSLSSNHSVDLNWMS